MQLHRAGGQAGFFGRRAGFFGQQPRGAGVRGVGLGDHRIAGAIAAAKSPPATLLKAKGKLFGPKTATGPSAI